MRLACPPSSRRLFVGLPAIPPLSTVKRPHHRLCRHSKNAARIERSVSPSLLQSTAAPSSRSQDRRPKAQPIHLWYLVSKRPVPLCTLVLYLRSFVPFVFVHVQYLLSNSGRVIIILIPPYFLLVFILTWIVWAKSGLTLEECATLP